MSESIPAIIHRLARDEIASPPPAIELLPLVPRAASTPSAQAVRAHIRAPAPSTGFSRSSVDQPSAPPPEGGTTNVITPDEVTVPTNPADDRGHSPPCEPGPSPEYMSAATTPVPGDEQILTPVPDPLKNFAARSTGFSRSSADTLPTQPAEGGTTSDWLAPANPTESQSPIAPSADSSTADVRQQDSDRLAESVTDHSHRLEQVSRDLDSSLTRLFTTQLETLDNLRQRLDDQERQWLEQQAVRRALV